MSRGFCVGMGLLFLVLAFIWMFTTNNPNSVVTGMVCIAVSTVYGCTATILGRLDKE